MVSCHVKAEVAEIGEIAEIDESIQTDPLVFNRTDTNGLMWPLPDWDDAGVLIMHSTHCVRMVRDYNMNDFTEINFMHGNHCAEVVKQYIGFFTRFNSYSAEGFMCKDTRYLTRTKRAAPGGYDYLKFDYSRKRRNVDNIQKEKQYKNQDEKQFFEISNNFGKLLLKQWRNHKLTETETDYLNKMRRPHTIRMAALGIYCNFGEDVNLVITKLSQYLADFKEKQFLN